MSKRHSFDKMGMAFHSVKNAITTILQLIKMAFSRINLAPLGFQRGIVVSEENISTTNKFFWMQDLPAGRVIRNKITY
jgi:hypothetical protein